MQQKPFIYHKDNTENVREIAVSPKAAGNIQLMTEDLLSR